MRKSGIEVGKESFRLGDLDLRQSLIIFYLGALLENVILLNIKATIYLCVHVRESAEKLLWVTSQKLTKLLK